MVRFFEASGRGNAAMHGPLKSMRVAVHCTFFEVKSTRALPCRKHPGVAGGQAAPVKTGAVGTIAATAQGGRRPAGAVVKVTVPPGGTPQIAKGIAGLMVAPDASKYSM